jgi:uncharacterized repeat protein (TIGR01451 family)
VTQVLYRNTAPLRRIRATVSGLVVVLGLSLCGVFSPSASAASAGPGWEISSVAMPTDFSTQDRAKCTEIGTALASACDRYVVTVTNVGSAPTSGPVVITDTLPPGLNAVDGTMLTLNNDEQPTTCVLVCTYEGILRPGETLSIHLDVEVTSATGVITNKASVSGGGAPPVSTSAPLTMPNTVNEAPPPFGVALAGFDAYDLSGGPDAQAGDHPNTVTARVNFATETSFNATTNIYAYSAVGGHIAEKDLLFYLPSGFVGNPTAAQQCTETQLLLLPPEAVNLWENGCPLASRVGSITLFEGNRGGEEATGTSTEGVSAVYEMVPEPGFPAQFGFKWLGQTVPMYASLVRTGSGYRVRVSVPDIPPLLTVYGAALTFLGNPNAANGGAGEPKAFFTNPVDCSGGALTVLVEADSWKAPGQWTSMQGVSHPQVAGCDRLQFDPSFAVRPETTQAGAPSGYEVDIKIPQQEPSVGPGLATSDLKSTTVTLSQGVSVNPGAANGLAGCPAEGPEGFNVGSSELGGGGRDIGDPWATEFGSSRGPGDGIRYGDGIYHTAPAHCPRSSQIGTVQATTPVLTQPLTGHVFLAAPKCGGAGQPACTPADATNGNLFGIYIEASGSGIITKFAGKVSVNPVTGQITTTVDGIPEQPVSDIRLRLDGGPGATLANPTVCGRATSTSDLVSWSSPILADATPSSSFAVDWDGAGGACPASLPFSPGFVAGTVSPTAGHFSPFTLTVGRGDRQQDISRLQVKTPPGLLGMLSQVPLCGEPQAAAGSCPESARVGTTRVAAGSGPHPLWETGRAYLTVGYGGAPFGLTAVVPAVAGPFNLGNVVVRSKISIDPHTSALTVTSDPLPQILDGVPLHLQTLNVEIDRPGFTFNPTSCARQQITARIEAAQGGSVDVSSPFAVEGCNSMPFHPSFRVSTQGNGTFGGGAKGRGASLGVKVGQAPGEAAIGKVDVQLPVALPSRLTTLQQACTEAQFAANPAGCPAGSNVGFAKATTPVLKVPLTGPAYLVSHGGAAFPDLVVVLQGNERGGRIRIDLVGNTNIKRGITYSNFDTVPDAPISSFELTLPEGPHSVLAAIRNLCALRKTLTVKSHGKRVKRTVPDPLLMPTTMTGQNGAVVKQNTKIAVTGCPKPSAKAGKARRARHAGKRH